MSSSERDLSQGGKNPGIKINDISAVDNSHVYQNNSNKAASSNLGTTVISGNHRIHLKVVDKMMKEKLKMLRQKEDADDQSRRKYYED
jgi:hypothetical protein